MIYQIRTDKYTKLFFITEENIYIFFKLKLNTIVITYMVYIRKVKTLKVFIPTKI